MNKPKVKDGAERRRSRRRPILDSFSLFLSMPKKGPHRLRVHDVSDVGMRFDVDTEGESPEDFPMALGEMVDVHFYLNQSLYLPLSLKIIRVEGGDIVRRVGGEFPDKNSKEYKAFHAFLEMLDRVYEAARFVTEPQTP
jgi:hypothetical protein